MLEGQLVRYTPASGETIAARVVQEVGGGVLISYHQYGDHVSTVVNVKKETLKTTGE